MALPKLEVVSLDWDADPTVGSRGAVLWTVEIRNNTDKYLEIARVNFTSYDAAGNVLDSDFSYMSGLQPGGTASVRSFATYFGNEEFARVQIDAGW